MRVHIVQHEVYEAPGAYLHWTEDRGYPVTFSKVYEGQPLPTDIDHLDMLIVMGGPQSPDTTLEECAHFDAAAEKKLIQQFVKAGKAVVGVCLGAQPIGDALGGKYEHSPEKEIGNFPITLTSAGLADEKIRHLAPGLTVGHWHNDMPGLTADSDILATSAGCPRQIIRYSNLVYGFQCHMELNTEVVALLIASEPDLLNKSTQYPFVQTPADIMSYDYFDMNNRLYQFLDHLRAYYEIVSYSNKVLGR